jgi:hypothetical protein
MTEIQVPKKVFIVPYRNRAQQKFFFSKYMNFILENESDYEIYFSHQCDARTFNRGATKDIGFLAVKNKYPQHYKDIDFVFNDVDTIPFNKIFKYETTHGIVKHFYGFKYALGGIVVIKGGDFETLNGYPCFWGWGMEDNSLQKRCDAAGLVVDRSVFYNIGSPEILQLFDGVSRIISKKDPWRGYHDNGIDGINSIHQLKYTIDENSVNPNDNIFTVHNPCIFFINIQTFLTYIPFGSEEYYNYDIREPPRKIVHPDKIRETRKTVSNTTDWTNIPYYPTTREKRINVAKYLQSMGKQVPESLLRQIAEDSQKEMDEDSYNMNQQPNNLQHQTHQHEQQMQQMQQMQQHQQYNQQPQQIQRQQPYRSIQNQQQIQIQRQRQPVPNNFSPAYAQYVGQRPRAQPSARVKLGGAY